MPFFEFVFEIVDIDLLTPWENNLHKLGENSFSWRVAHAPKVFNVKLRQARRSGKHFGPLLLRDGKRFVYREFPPARLKIRKRALPGRPPDELTIFRRRSLRSFRNAKNTASPGLVAPAVVAELPLQITLSRSRCDLCKQVTSLRSRGREHSSPSPRAGWTAGSCHDWAGSQGMVRDAGFEPATSCV